MMPSLRSSNFPRSSSSGGTSPAPSLSTTAAECAADRLVTRGRYGGASVDAKQRLTQKQSVSGAKLTSADAGSVQVAPVG